jgi:two-component system sensor histidine kinase UhpB
MLQHGRLWLRNLSTFEKVIVANSCIILLDSAAGWWVTQHNPEPYHYIIDTAFIILASILGLAVNFVVLRAAFAPLHTVLATIRIVARGDVHARVTLPQSGADTAALAEAFNMMLDRLEEMHRESAARVLHAQEEERRHLALELHDQTGQSLTALALHAEAIAQRLEQERSTNAKQARRQIEQLGVLAQRTLTEVQEISRQLRPPLLDDMGLEAALRWLAEDASDRLRVEVTVHIDTLSALNAADDSASTQSDVPVRFLADVETALFRIAQESVTNAVRHGHAAWITIDLFSTVSDVVLQVTDDGSGFDTTTTSSNALGNASVGIEGMRERAQLIGGRFTVCSRQGQGCMVTVSVPRSPAISASVVIDAPHVTSASTASDHPEKRQSHGPEASSASQHSRREDR